MKIIHIQASVDFDLSIPNEGVLESPEKVIKQLQFCIRQAAIFTKTKAFYSTHYPKNVKVEILTQK
jgi:hypothetical protein